MSLWVEGMWGSQMQVLTLSVYYDFLPCSAGSKYLVSAKRLFFLFSSVPCCHVCLPLAYNIVAPGCDLGLTGYPSALFLAGSSPRQLGEAQVPIHDHAFGTWHSSA